MGLSVVVSSVAFGAFIKGATGAGLPLVAIPVLATQVGVEEAVVIMAIPTLTSNLMMLRAYPHKASEVRDLATLVAAGLPGVGIGVSLLATLSTSIMSLVLSGTVLLYVIVRLIQPEIELAPSISRYAAVPVGLAAGALQGVTGVSGPLVALYLHSYRMPRSTYLFSLTFALQVFSIAQILAFVFLGLFTWQRLILSMLAVVPVAMALTAGIALSRRLSTRAFDTLVLLVLVASAAKLAIDAVLT